MMQTVDFSQTKVLGGFWKQKQDMVRKTTIYAVYDRFVETGRFDAFQFNWKEGMPHKPDIFWDSDVAKWMEAAAYLTWQKREPKLEKLVDNTVDLIEKNQCEDGYFNVYFTIVEPDKRFSDRRWHELYCAGHLIEAAVAYYEATGKRKFLDCMCRYADYIEKRFKIDQDTAFSSPGHEEIELALVRLFECTGEKRYLDLAEYFVLIRGTEADKGKDTLDGGLYSQAHKPAAQQDEAEGHAVRAVYFYCAMADIAYHTGNQELLAACKKLFADIITKKMYITGGIGSSSRGEAFTLPYDLNNELAYAETCAAIGLAFFANRMLKLENDSVYSDTIERIIYNGFLSSTSLDGKAFFYENPLEIIPMMSKRDRSCTWIPGIHWPQTQRSEVFECSCCPPNIARFIPTIANLMYTDDGQTLFVHQFMQAETKISRGQKAITVTQKTAYPENGKVRITVTGGDTRIAVRIPGWFDGYTGKTVKGYAYFDVKDGETLSFDFAMKVKLMEARPEAVFDCNRYAVQRGPVVYCMESVDNGANIRDIRLDSRARFAYGKHRELGVPQLTVKAWRRRPEADAPLYSARHDNLEKMEAVLIPYYAFANRGEAEMQVWHFIK